MIDSTGPNTSSRAMRISFVTPATTAGWKKNPLASSPPGRSPPVSTFAVSFASSMNPRTRSSCRSVMRGPTCVAGCMGSPAMNAPAAAVTLAANSSSTERSTSRRLPAMHCWPEYRKHAQHAW